MANSCDAKTKKCNLSEADASAIEIHIVALFGKDQEIARRNDQDAKSAMASMSETSRDRNISEGDLSSPVTVGSFFFMSDLYVHASE